MTRSRYARGTIVVQTNDKWEQDKDKNVDVAIHALKLSGSLFGLFG